MLVSMMGMLVAWLSFLAEKKIKIKNCSFVHRDVYALLLYTHIGKWLRLHLFLTN